MNGYADFGSKLQCEIEAAYLSSGNVFGWRFLYSPKTVLKGADVALIGLNPGGSSKDPNHAEFAMAAGSAYRDEKWPDSSKLQKEVLALFTRLGVEPETVLAGNLVPFRSPDWASLKNREEALRFGLSLWRRVFERASPSVIVTMGREANDAVAGLMSVQSVVEYPVGWGTYTARRGLFGGGTWIGLPHLSRFTIMTREASKPALDSLFEGI